jgi:hypothetical protein
MWCPFVGLIVLIAGAGTAACANVAEEPRPITVVCPKSASFVEKLAAKEIRRYFYVRTGRLAAIADSMGDGDMIVVGTMASLSMPAVDLISDAQSGLAVMRLGRENYLLKSADRKDGSHVVLVIGGDPIGTLYGAYRFAEHLGVRFYMHGDVVPDERIPPKLPERLSRRSRLVDDRRLQGHHRAASQDADEFHRPAHLSAGRRGPGTGRLDRPA